MGDSNIDLAVIKRTQNTLGKFIKKPPLTEKLLKKPPFRFLFDVINVVIKDTGCFVGLYTAEEMNIENIKDREDKMRYLQKMIDVIKIVTNQQITVRTSKIVAGQEPEKTNELLQLIGEVIEKKLDWKAAVESVNDKSNVPDVINKPQKPQKPKEKVNSKDSKDLDVKTKEKPKIDGKTKEKSKHVEVNTKEKSKDGVRSKESKKSVSPGTNVDKSKKVSTSKEKPKQEKASKELKEKVSKNTKNAVEKPKPTKPIAAVKEKSPSPVREEPVEVKQSPQKETKLQEIQCKPEPIPAAPPTESAEAQVVEQPKDVPTADSSPVEPKVGERMSPNKIIENLEEVPIPTPSNEIIPKVAETPKESESRKSSGSRRSSGKSRRTSASKVKRDEDENNATSVNQTESLTALNEEEPTSAIMTSAVTTSATKTEEPAPTEQKASPEIPSNNAQDVKRESTFTREGSKAAKEAPMNRPRTSLRPPSARPASARPGAPRRRDKNVEIILQPNDQIKMSGINVKLETFGDFDDDGENLVIIENANVDEALSMQTSPGNTLNSEEGLEQQGHLVQQILETQKELVHQNSDGVGRPDKDSSTLNTRQSSARQMNNLRDVIQNLTKSVNPFGKLMDFIPEDIDAMQLELSMWRDTYSQAANELRKEKSLTESATEPMKNQLLQIEANIKEYQEMIDSSRAKTLQNAEKILKLFTE